MSYTVSQLAKLSGVSVRTLHYYDERGLLAPVSTDFHGARRYGEAELLRLQSILFYRELGLSLNQIQAVLRENTGGTVATLEAHRRALTRDIEHKRTLVETIDQTIRKLKGEHDMPDNALFYGLNSDKQQSYEAQLIHQCGDGVRPQIDRSRDKVKDWNQDRWDEVMDAFAKTMDALAKAKVEGARSDSERVQTLVRGHYDWLRLFWEPDRSSYAGFADLIEKTELREAYARGDDTLPEYLGAAIRRFAVHQLV